MGGKPVIAPLCSPQTLPLCSQIYPQTNCPTTNDLCVTVLLALSGLTVAVPADEFRESIPNPDEYDDDLFVPVSDKENFDVFDWQLCKVNPTLFILIFSKLRVR